jgi:hypothetical protein
MIDFSDDIFTEPEMWIPDTLANLGPLRPLAGVWEGRKGVDLNPKAEGPERRDYLERIEMQPIDPQANGPQLLYGLRYHVHIVASDEDTTFHDQVGYWLWEPATGLIMQTLAIPRGRWRWPRAGRAGRIRPVVRAERGGPGYGICSTDFLEWAFRTDSYELDVRFEADGGWSYVSTTMLQVRGRTAPFRHVDRNTLHKVGRASAQSFARIAAGAGHPGRGARLHDNGRRDRRTVLTAPVSRDLAAAAKLSAGCAVEPRRIYTFVHLIYLQMITTQSGSWI